MLLHEKNGKVRNLNLDIIRCVAIFSVISVHFFLNNGFYEEIVFGKRMYLMVIMRTVFMICVPLFVLLTGYLMCKKELSKKYYCGIIKTLQIYVTASIFVLLFQKFYFKMDIKFLDSIQNIIGFDIGYAWYVEMYIGLFLIIPYLNLIWAGLDTKKRRLGLLCIFLACTVLPSFVDGALHLNIPAWWQRMWPITYYFIGAYIREYNPYISIKKGVAIFVSTALIFGTYNFYRSFGNIFEWGSYNEWNSFENVIDSTLVFLICMQIKKTPNFTKNIIIKISELSFGTYLVSVVFDNLFYGILNDFVPVMKQRLEYYVLIVPVVFLCSMCTSQLILWGIDAAKRLIKHKR